MKALDALEILRRDGTLRNRPASRGDICPKDVNTPVSIAAQALLRRMTPESKELAWMAPSDCMSVLP